MSITTRQQIIDTSHGSLAVEESGQGEIPVLLIHGNSFCRGVFRHQLQGTLAENRRLIAFDLPGHGQRSSARRSAYAFHSSSVSKGMDRTHPIEDFFAVLGDQRKLPKPLHGSFQTNHHISPATL